MRGRALHTFPSLWGIWIFSLVHVRQTLLDTSMDFKHWWVWKDLRFFCSFFSSICQSRAWTDLNTLSPWAISPPTSTSCLPLPLYEQSFVILAVVFCGPVIFVFLWSTNIRCGRYRRLHCSWSLPLQPAITVLFLVTQVRFWSLAPLQKNKNKSTHTHTRDGTGGKTSQLDLLGLRNDFLSSPWKQKSFFTGTFTAPPTIGRYKFWTSATATRNAQKTWTFKL